MLLRREMFSSFQRIARDLIKSRFIFLYTRTIGVGQLLLKYDTERIDKSGNIRTAR